MKIVIDIPQEDYDFIQESEFMNADVTRDLYVAVYKGKVIDDGQDHWRGTRA